MIARIWMFALTAACALAVGCTVAPSPEPGVASGAAVLPGPPGSPPAPGVTDDEVVVGMNAAFSGPSAGLGIEMWRGVSAAFDEVNAGGGVHGRKIRLVLADDGYDTERAEPAIRHLIEEERVFCTGWSVGTPTIARALPLILERSESEGLFHFTNFTGAQIQRKPPFARAVFNLRASYFHETKDAVDEFLGLGRRRIGVFAQNDAYGNDGRDGVAAALREHGLQIVAEARYTRGAKFDENFSAAVDSLRQAGADAVVMIGAYQASAGFVRDARERGWDAPIHSVSFVGPAAMFSLLASERSRVPGILNDLYVTQVVPDPVHDTSAGAVAFRAAIDRFQPVAPAEFPASGYTSPAAYSFGAFEGYLSAVLFVRILEANGRELSRASFVRTAEATGSRGGIDLGIGTRAAFSPENHQAMDRVWMTTATPDGWRDVAASEADGR